MPRRATSLAETRQLGLEVFIRVAAAGDATH
jgi:hypothetical protein